MKKASREETMIRHIKKSDLDKVPFLQHTRQPEDITQLSLADYQPKRFGLKYNPPTIVLEYMVASTGKLYHHKMKLLSLTPVSDTKEMITYLQKRHALYLMTNRISDKQIEDLITRLKRGLEREEGRNSTTTAPKENKFSRPSHGVGPLGKKAKQLKKIERESEPGVGKVITKGDDEISDDKKQNILSVNGSKTVITSTPPSQLHPLSQDQEVVRFQTANGWDQKEINFGKINYDKYNLNKLDDEELKVHKDKMEGLFLKNYKDPKDRGFVYDIEENFSDAQKYDEGWDDFEEDDDEELLP